MGKLSGLRVLCISASNRIDSEETNSYRKCKAALEEVEKHIPDVQGEIIELQYHSLNPCTACSRCKNSKRCAIDSGFNQIYEKIVTCDILFIIAPHYALAPAKLCMILEKMGQVVTIHSSKDKSYQSETYGLKTAIITHGATAIDEIAQKKKKTVLNDPISVALHDTQAEIIPFSDEWDTGICVQPIKQNYDGESLSKINEYVRRVINYVKTIT
jgi:Multimeric flavodoxin WrbA